MHLSFLGHIGPSPPALQEESIAVVKEVHAGVRQDIDGSHMPEHNGVEAGGQQLILPPQTLLHQLLEFGWLLG